MNPELANYLIEHGIADPEEINGAEGREIEKGIPFEQSLVEMGIVDPAGLGKALSDLYMMPYVGLEGRMLPPDVEKVVCSSCAQRWGVFPVEIDAESGVVSFAVTGPEQAVRIEKIYKFLMEPYDLAFTVASAPEIASALTAEYEEPAPGDSIAQQKKPDDVALFGGSTSADSHGKRKLPIGALRQKSQQGEDARSDSSPSPAPVLETVPVTARETEIPESMIPSLMSAMTLLVEAHLGADQKALFLLRTRTRYAQLLAVRLSLSQTQTLKLVLAAWASGLKNKREVLRQLITPFDLESIAFPAEPGKDRGIVGSILDLLECYEEIARSSRGGLDVNMVRRRLLSQWSGTSGHQDVLETFLQVLMDEQFLGKFGKPAGTMLVVGLSPQSARDVSNSLGRSGYVVKAADSAARTIGELQASRPDMVIICAQGGAADAVELCRQVRAQFDPGLPLLAVLDGGTDARETELLRAGVDDVMTSPVDPQLLYLKVDRRLASGKTRTSKGVSGSLKDLSFMDMIQVLTAGARSMAISVSREDKQGCVFMRQGNIVHAETGELSGEPAFYELMRWHDGDFSMEECSEFPPATISSSTMSLLMEGARLADEDASL